MVDKPSTQQFGKRRPAQPAPAQPPKRSGHVALLVMGTLAVGGGAYALMPSENCQPAAPGMAAPACTSRGWSGGGSSGGGYSRSSRYSFFGGDSSSSSSSAGVSEQGSVSRGGFGSFGRAFGFGGE
jgi:hypothetical protein